MSVFQWVEVMPAKSETLCNNSTFVLSRHATPTRRNHCGTGFGSLAGGQSNQTWDTRMSVHFCSRYFDANSWLTGLSHVCSKLPDRFSTMNHRFEGVEPQGNNSYSSPVRSYITSMLWKRPTNQEGVSWLHHTHATRLIPVWQSDGPPTIRFNSRAPNTPARG
jgi:hypothetical protein